MKASLEQRVALLEDTLARFMDAELDTAADPAEPIDDAILRDAMRLPLGARWFYVLSRSAKEAGLTLDQLRGPSKVSWIVTVRDDTIWRLRKLNMSTPQIGRVVWRDHSSVLKALERRAKRLSGL